MDKVRPGTGREGGLGHVAPEPTRKCLWRVLKEGTAQPLLP